MLDVFAAIRPYPRVAPIRAPTKRRNKRGSTRILTATPEKKLIDEEAENKKQKMQRTLEAKNKNLLKKSGNDAEKTAKGRRGAKRTLSEL